MRAYERRRGWLAFHSGGAAMAKNPDLAAFMGMKKAAGRMTPEQMLANVRRFSEALNKGNG